MMVTFAFLRAILLIFFLEQVSRCSAQTTDDVTLITTDDLMETTTEESTEESTTRGTTKATTVASGNSQRQLSPGAVAGITVGVVVLAILVIVILICIVKSKASGKVTTSQAFSGQQEEEGIMNSGQQQEDSC
ncbi:uncharacterized protein [Amphiura filiformis]|uniref:uncharacterized protein n=1 Tax=Amphiura filiformis TaxID=82378 RepID=UPI003B20EA30